MKEYDVIIGLEIHIQTKTKTKMFCPCSTEYFEKAPNTQVCGVCLGLPGALPVPNRLAIEKCILFGLATKCKISEKIRFDRKHYFYPDLPKGYQISQYDNPICSNGFVMIKNEKDQSEKIELERIHQEEDVAKSIHIKNYSLIDYNKSSVPLIEIVTKPIIKNAYDAKEYASKIRQIARYLNISDADMEKGQMRCEPNISVQKKGTWEYKEGKIIPKDNNELNPKVEIKNIGSISAVEKSINHEIKRLIEKIENEEKIEQQTRGWNAEKNETEFQRSKETAEDYRYFPEPDIPVIKLNKKIIEKIKKDLIELPDEKINRYINDFKLSEYDANILTADKEIATFYETILNEINSPKILANLLTGSIFSFLNDSKKDIKDLKINTKSLKKLISMIEDKKILYNKAKEILEKSLSENKDIEEFLNDEKNTLISDENEIETLAQKVIDENPQPVEDFKNGKTNAIGFLVGQLMKLTKGNANPQISKEILEKLIKKN